MKVFVLLLFLSLFPAQGPTDKATVFIYELPHKKMLTRVAPLILCDDKPLAEIPGGKYFVVKLTPGRYSFHGKNKKKGGVEIDLQPGRTYYLKVKLDADGYFLRFAGLELMPEENGRFDIRQLKPINERDIKNRELVSLTP